MAGASDSPDTASYIRTLPETECFELLAVATVGRVGFVSPAGVQIIPMDYRLGADRQLFMKTAPGSALAKLAEVDAEIAFEVDYHADDFRIAWSVLMNGTISRLACCGDDGVRRPQQATRSMARVSKLASSTLRAAYGLGPRPASHSPGLSCAAPAR